VSTIDIAKLSPEERLALLEQLWDSLSPEAIPMTDAQKAELDREGAFLAAAQRVIDAVAQHPLRYPVIRRNTRRALLRRFPYAVYFRVYGLCRGEFIAGVRPSRL